MVKWTQSCVFLVFTICQTKDWSPAWRIQFEQVPWCPQCAAGTVLPRRGQTCQHEEPCWCGSECCGSNTGMWRCPVRASCCLMDWRALLGVEGTHMLGEAVIRSRSGGKEARGLLYKWIPSRHEWLHTRYMRRKRGQQAVGSRRYFKYLATGFILFPVGSKKWT